MHWKMLWSINTAKNPHLHNAEPGWYILGIVQLENYGHEYCLYPEEVRYFWKSVNKWKQEHQRVYVW